MSGRHTRNWAPQFSEFLYNGTVEYPGRHRDVGPWGSSNYYRDGMPAPWTYDPSINRPGTPTWKVYL